MQIHSHKYSSLYRILEYLLINMYFLGIFCNLLISCLKFLKLQLALKYIINNNIEYMTLKKKKKLKSKVVFNLAQFPDISIFYSLYFIRPWNGSFLWGLCQIFSLSHSNKCIYMCASFEFLLNTLAKNEIVFQAFPFLSRK